MTYLELCQKVDVLLGSQGTFSTVATTNGYQQLIVEYVKNAWSNIQATRRFWDFRRAIITWEVTEGKEDYSIEDLFGAGATNPVENWIIDRFIRIPIGISTVEYNEFLTFIPYDDWILEDRRNPQVHPRSFSIFPNPATVSDSLLSIDSPDDEYHYNCHYYLKPQELSVDADVPTCPPEHHDAIIFQALADLAAHLGNPDIYSTASVRANQLYGNLLRSQNVAKNIKMRPFA